MLVRNNDRSLLHNQLFPLHPGDDVTEDGKVRNAREQAGQTDRRHNVPLDVRCCIGEGRVRRRREECGDDEKSAGQTDGVISAVRVEKVWVGTSRGVRLTYK